MGTPLCQWCGLPESEHGKGRGKRAKHGPFVGPDAKLDDSVKQQSGRCNCCGHSLGMHGGGCLLGKSWCEMSGCDCTEYKTNHPGGVQAERIERDIRNGVSVAVAEQRWT